MIGTNILEYDSVDSTNLIASGLLGDRKATDGTVVWAHEQFAGKGQGANRWESESGKNLTFTVILKPSFLPADRQFLLNKAVALGVSDFVEAFLTGQAGENSPVESPPVRIKWPNDIFIGTQKVGGILIENRVQGGFLESSLVGIGLNINQTRFAPDIPNPISLIHLLRHEVVIREAIQIICHTLDLRYATLVKGRYSDLCDDYNSRMLGFSEWRPFRSGEETIEGKITGVDDYGRLLVSSRRGKVTPYMHKEIEFLL